MAYDTLVLIIDNYDSFVYNLVHVLAEQGARSIVVRNDEITISGVERINPDRIIISPGPGNPLVKRDVGISVELVRRLGPRIPILGVCMGHQVVGVAYGAKIRRARRIMHGKLDVIEHYGNRLYRGVPRVFTAVRYHSLVVGDPPEHLEVTARSRSDGEIMGLRHVEYPVHGVQFHPESVASPTGPRILRNFLDDPW
ncbi:Anthranilate synthase, amidotransferase component [Pyrodictium delaneyi]|uniref:anthranilate synthase n=1 Tax=Pyrodictium delaneyi TaxID=1273541 RepID=A0A0P0N472_9CREN|nr:aminodeoxychorismate/anthranilate synthase component II [Pyrodictium delaneyi]ALL00982.1 Anthranilate synthase, amidotransferase component [Pyrodictium delaneyi]OWJ55411.1 aminodeoxychorismate/anthranilate synthase component II [Pyrodictium delaneyi]